MKWTLYIGPKAERIGRFDSPREAKRAARHSTEEGDFFFLIGRREEARRLSIYRRDEEPLLTTETWELGREADMAKEILCNED